MKTSFIGLLGLTLASACASGQQTAQKTTTIATVLCEIDQKDYQSAEKNLESLRVADPKNFDLQKLLAAVRGKMIASGDKSAENIARIRKAIESYSQLLADTRLSADDKNLVDKAIVDFYTRLGEEELKKHLLTRAADPNRSASDHVEILTVLAGKSWDCSFTITSRGTKVAAEIARAKACATEGLDYSNQALKIAPDDVSVWSYKTNLLNEAAKIAGLQGRQAEKASYQKQSDEALKQTTELSKKAKAAKEKELASEPEVSSGPAQSDESQDLTEFKGENSLADAASAMLYVPLELVQPLKEPGSPEPTATSQPNLAQQKYDWKTVAAAEDLTIDLPDNITETPTSYSAASEGVVYSILSTDRTSIQADPAVADRIMNTLARSYARLDSRGWLDAGLGNKFEMKLFKKEMVNGEPQKHYTYVLGSCTERKEGVLLVQATKDHFYTIVIFGANDSDPRVQRVLSSIKVK